MAFNHWVLFVGYDGNRPLIADLPGEVTAIDETELLAIWDGVAVIVSVFPAKGYGSFQFNWILFDVIPWLGFVLTFLVFGKWAVARTSTLAFTWVVVATMALLIAFRHGILNDGLFRNPNSLAIVMQASLPIEVVDRQRAVELIRKASIVVDARFPAQFHRVHVRGAINIPYYVTRSELKKRMSGIEKDQEIVVYCAGPKCPFATIVARMLRAQGRKNVYVYEGEDIQLHRDLLQSAKDVKTSP